MGSEHLCAENNVHKGLKNISDAQKPSIDKQTVYCDQNVTILKVSGFYLPHIIVTLKRIFRVQLVGH